MKFFPALAIFFLFSIHAIAQPISAVQIKLLQKSEDSLKGPSWKIVTGINPSDRLKADSIFTRMFVRTLKTPNSFYYNFDSLQTISQLYAPDSTFKIFTWQMPISENLFRQHGAIQMRTNDGSLKLFPLIDKSDITQDIADTVGNNYGWMGAVYYKIILTKNNNENFYTFLGFDANNIRSDKKVIEVLHFENGEPIFGGHYFSVPNDSIFVKNPARYIMEFKKEAGPRLTYDAEMQMIVMEHLISESNQPRKKYTLVGDGDYQGFKWMNGKWIYVDRIFNQVTPEGQPPVPVPLNVDGTIKDDDGSAKPKTAPRKNKS